MIDSQTPPLGASERPEIAPTNVAPLEHGAPATPVGAAPTAAAASGVARAFGAWWGLLKAVFSGEPARVTDAALGSSSGGSTHRTWMVAAATNGLIIGLSIAILMARLAAKFEYFFAPDASNYFAAFLIPVVCAIALILARAGAIVGLFVVRQRTIAFRDAAALASTSFVVAAPFLAVALVLSLIPGTFALVILLVVGIFTAFYAEILLYVAVARVGRFAKSPALPHAVLSTVWLCVMAFIATMVVTDAATDLIDALRVAL